MATGGGEKQKRRAWRIIWVKFRVLGVAKELYGGARRSQPAREDGPARWVITCLRAVTSDDQSHDAPH